MAELRAALQAAQSRMAWLHGGSPLHAGPGPAGFRRSSTPAVARKLDLGGDDVNDAEITVAADPVSEAGAAATSQGIVSAIDSAADVADSPGLAGPATPAAAPEAPAWPLDSGSTAASAGHSAADAARNGDGDGDSNSNSTSIVTHVLAAPAEAASEGGAEAETHAAGGAAVAAGAQLHGEAADTLPEVVPLSAPGQQARAILSGYPSLFDDRLEARQPCCQPVAPHPVPPISGQQAAACSAWHLLHGTTDCAADIPAAAPPLPPPSGYLAAALRARAAAAADIAAVLLAGAGGRGGSGCGGRDHCLSPILLAGVLLGCKTGCLRPGLLMRFLPNRARCSAVMSGFSFGKLRMLWSKPVLHLC